ncbi:HAD family hydrolase [Oceanospirillum linum]|uniref:Phosphatase n=1 Tax=Oceanospirillum linum TaxID=966 RepID=A0A1T1HAJ0_OCELI|nr:HAD family hydrolase [Oceanospirillum linum]OOV86760.1 phosphatase [Oceanospirillum linum]SEG23320.1 haloacid dehalogenase superfamily, subfamily IA, variant 3 with third motif having DD or ED/haloacid dehalogenase superfamily, subfamily IA, variant 1 with third motif having Dx(3-4)D or Dx(3-4)E [Oleiphilus messinensis]SMP25553.1 haloacid dehalogenase superfamily, subfamily IA, variant 3 with third motif having DD or ED/haloacid dehalogenase superfamily, subfamily IA, variant 1 with third mot
MKNIKGVIFDLDGTLVSSSLDFQWLRQQVNCPDEDDILTFTAQLQDPYLKDRANSIIEQHELDDAHQANWIPGAKLFVDCLNQNNYPMAIVTRNFQQAAQIKIRNNAMPITRIITREEAPAKPDPTALLMIATEWRLKPEQVMYVGDFRYDVEAANNAGMHSCLYAPDELPDYAHQADQVIRHFDELTATLKSLN